MKDVLEELVTKFTYDVDQAGLNKYLRSQKKINRNTKIMIGLNTTLSKVMRRLFFGAGAIMGVNSLVQTYRNFDLVQRSLNALTGSAEEGAKHFEFLKKAALDTATDFNQVAKAYRGYYYAAKTAGLTNEELQHSFLGVMIGARVLGSGKVSVGGAMLALEQMLNKTTVQAEEMNRQLGNAISGAREMSAEAMGMSVAEFTEKMQKKQIQSAEFVKKFGDYMYQTFIKKLPEALKSLDAGIINLQNAWLIFQHEIMKGGLGEELTKLTGQLMQLLLSPEAKGVAKTIGQGLNLVGKALSFIVKHFRAILFLWGTNTLMGGIRNLYRLRKSIVDLAMDIGYGKVSLGGALDNIVYALSNIITTGGGIRALIKSIGTALIPLGRSMLWITAIATALYGIYLILEDIFTYINHPEAESLTKELAERLPIIDDFIYDIKSTIEQIQPTLHDLSEVWGEFGINLLEILKVAMPLFEFYMRKGIVEALFWGKILSWILKILLKIINAVTRAIGGIKQLTGLSVQRMNNLSDMMIEHPYLATGATFNPLGTYATKKGFDFINQLSMPDYTGSITGGYNLNKVMTNQNNSTNYFNVYAQDRSDTEIINLFQRALAGELDATQRLMGGY